MHAIIPAKARSSSHHRQYTDTHYVIRYTQVTVDPTSCWSAVAAADLDNGSPWQLLQWEFCSGIWIALYWVIIGTITLESQKWVKRHFGMTKRMTNWLKTGSNCYVFSVEYILTNVVPTGSIAGIWSVWYAQAGYTHIWLWSPRLVLLQ